MDDAETKLSGSPLQIVTAATRKARVTMPYANILLGINFTDNRKYKT